MRQSNIELCRIISILLIIMGHGCFNSIGHPTSLEDTNIISLFIESFCSVGVNVFVLISGYFSVAPKKKSLINLLYICFFYSLVSISFDALSGNITRSTYKSFFIVSGNNWFVGQYLGLLLISPILNSFVETSSKRQFGIFLVAFLLYQTWFGFRPGLLYRNVFAAGYSFISFAFFYLLARYYRLYGAPFLTSKSRCLFVYSGISILMALCSAFCLYIGKSEIEKFGGWYNYINPFVILSSFALFCFFTKLEIRRSSLINKLASSTLGVLLLHTSHSFFPYMQSVFQHLYLSNNAALILVLGGAISIIIYIVSVIIDQIRKFTYNQLLKILKI